MSAVTGEVYEVTAVSGTTTVLTIAAAVGDSKITVSSAADLYTWCWVRISESTNVEFAQVKIIDGSSLRFSGAIRYAYTTSAVVKRVTATLKVPTTDYTITRSTGAIALVSGKFTASNEVFISYSTTGTDLDHYELYRIPGKPASLPDGASYSEVTGYSGAVTVSDSISSSATSTSDTSLSDTHNGEDFTYFLFAVDGDDNESLAQGVAAQTVPGRITNLSCNCPNPPGTSAALSWTNPTGSNFDGVDIYRCPNKVFSPATAVKVNSTTITTNSFVDGSSNTTNRRPSGEVPYPVSTSSYSYAAVTLDLQTDWDNGTSVQSSDPSALEDTTCDKQDVTFPPVFGSLLWQYDLTPSSLDYMGCHPIALSNNGSSLYIADYDGLVKLDTSGNHVWTYATTLSTFFAGPHVAPDGTIFIVDADNRVRAITDNGSSYSLKWTHTNDTNFKIKAPLVVGGDSSPFLIGTDSTGNTAQMHKLSSTTGASSWSNESSSKLAVDQVTCGDGTYIWMQTYVSPTSTADLYPMGASGSSKGKIDLGSSSQSMQGTNLVTLPWNSSLKYMSVYSRRALDSTHRHIMENLLKEPTYSSTGTHLQLRTHTGLAPYSAQANVLGQGIALFNDRRVVYPGDSRLYMYATPFMQEIAKTSSLHTIRDQPAVSSGGIIYVGDCTVNGHKALAFNKHLQELWHFTIPGTVSSTTNGFRPGILIMADGRFVFCGSNGVVYCFEGDTSSHVSTVWPMRGSNPQRNYNVGETTHSAVALPTADRKYGEILVTSRFPYDESGNGGIAYGGTHDHIYVPTRDSAHSTYGGIRVYSKTGAFLYKGPAFAYAHYGAPMVVGNAVYQIQNNRITKYTDSGSALTVAWNTTSSVVKDTYTFHGCGYYPMTVDSLGNIYSLANDTTYSQSLNKWNPSTGARAWSLRLSTGQYTHYYRNPVIDSNDYIYLMDYNRNTYCVDTVTPSIKFSVTPLSYSAGYFEYIPIVDENDRLYISGTSGSLGKWSNTGSTLSAAWQVGGGNASRFVHPILTDTLYIQSGSGNSIAKYRSNGGTAWTNTSAAISSTSGNSPVLCSDGNIYHVNRTKQCVGRTNASTGVGADIATTLPLGKTATTTGLSTTNKGAHDCVIIDGMLFVADQFVDYDGSQGVYGMGLTGHWLGSSSINLDDGPWPCSAGNYERHNKAQ